MSKPTQFQWSPLQEAIFSAAREPSHSSVIVQAVAGSGKTTTLVGTALRAPEKTKLAVAFNKRIATELQQKLPDVACSTFNSMGHRAWAKAVGKRLSLNTNKIFDIAGAIAKAEGYIEVLADIMALAKAARTAGLVPSEAEGNFTTIVEDTHEEWQAIADTKNLVYTDSIAFFARQTLIESIKQSFAGIIDFDDQIYMSSLWKCMFTKYDFILVDEAQDLNELQHIMIRKSCFPKTRVFAFGDRHQAIYGFRGALHNSMDQLADTFSMAELPLDISYRCPQAVVHEAQKHVPGIHAHPDAPEGSVTFLGTNWTPESIKNGSAIVCRNNAPLFRLAFQLIRAERGVTILGREIGKSLVRTVEKITHRSDTQISDFLVLLSRWEEDEVSKAPNREKIIHDTVSSLQALCNPTIKSSKDLILWIEKLFAKESAPIVLCSVHKAKGLEWENVYLLDSWRIPSAYAFQDWELEQEDNLRYVAQTRAKENLFYIDLPEK